MDCKGLTEFQHQCAYNEAGLRFILYSFAATVIMLLYSTESKAQSLNIDSLILVPESPVLVGTDVSFRALVSGGTPPYSYKWTFGDGSELDFSEGQAEVQHSYASPNNYLALLQVRDSSGTFRAQTKRLIAYQSSGGALPTRSSPIIVYSREQKVWLVNPDNNSVSALGVNTLLLEHEVAVGEHPMSLAADRHGRIWVVCRDNDSVWVLNSASGSVEHVLRLDRGSAPVGIVFSPDGSTAYIAEEGRGRITRVDANSQRISATIYLGPTPRALAVAGDGSMLYATRFISAGNAGNVYSLNLSNFQRGQVISLPIDTQSDDTSGSARGLPNYLVGIAIHPGNAVAWTSAKKDNILAGAFRDGTGLGPETTVRSLVSTLELETRSEIVSQRKDIDDHAQPSSVTFSERGSHAFVTMQGNNRLLVFNPYTRAEVARVQTGLAPQGAAIDSASGRVFVKNFMDRSVSVYDGSDMLKTGAPSLPFIQTVPATTSETFSPEILRGKQIFYNSADTRMAALGYLSCATCHLDGGHDGQTLDFTQRGEGLRNTTSLRGGAGATRGRVHWTGNFDEIQDFEHDMRFAFGGTGFMSDEEFNTGTRNQTLGDPKAGVSAELDALAAYVNSLDDFGRSPFRRNDGGLTDSGLRGADIFRSLNCTSCHSGLFFSDSAAGIRHDVGTAKPSSGGRLGGAYDGFDTPSLRGLFNSAPYLHDGSGESIIDVLTTSNTSGLHGNTLSLTQAQLEDLSSYLLQLDGSLLKAYLPLNERDGALVRDLSGNGHNGAIGGDAALVPGRVGRGAHFSALDDRIDLGILKFSENVLSAGAWIRLDEKPEAALPVLLMANGTALDDRFFGLEVVESEGSRLHFTLNFDGRVESITGANLLEVNTWYHAAAVYDGAEMRLYLNGSLAASRRVNGSFSNNTDIRAAIGNYASGIGRVPFHGTIDEVRIYDRVLRELEISDLSSPGLDSTPPAAPSGLRRVSSSNASLRIRTR